MRKRGRSYEIAVIAILAACNATLELTVGNYLQIVKFPLSGSVMVGINIIIYSLGYALVPKKGTIISMGFLTAAINLFFGGSFKPWSIIAIFLESALIEFIINVMKFHFWSIMTASVIANLFGFVYTLAVFAYISGIGIVNAIHKASAGLKSHIPWVRASLLVIFLLLVAFHVVMAVASGFLTWKLVGFADLFLKNRKYKKNV